MNVMTILLLATMGCRYNPDIKGDSSPADSGVDPAQAWAPLTDLGFTNIVIIQEDTFRADHLPFYGYERNTLPLATARSGWLVHERSYASTSWTTPSVSSMLTGMDIHHHGVRTGSAEGGDVLDDPTFAGHFNDLGYQTALFSGNLAVSTDSGLDKDWQTYGLDISEPDNSTRQVDAALTWLETVPEDQPFVLWLQPMDTHQPWHANAADLGTWSDASVLPFSLEDTKEIQQQQLMGFLQSEAEQAERDAVFTAIRDVYDEEILGLDRQIDRMLSYLETSGRIDNTLVMISGDHGETLFDSDETFGHGGSLREELVKIPTIFYHPTFTDGVIEDCPTVNYDLFPTLLHAMGLPQMDVMDGAPVQESGCRPHVFNSIYREEDGTVNLRQIGINSLHSKIVYDCINDYVMAYDLDADPGALAPRGIIDVLQGNALQSELDAYLAEILTVYPEMSCTMTL